MTERTKRYEGRKNIQTALAQILSRSARPCKAKHSIAVTSVPPFFLNGEEKGGNEQKRPDQRSVFC